jgi:hypothetical protein
MYVVHSPINPPSQNNLAMSPLPLKKGLSALQPIVEVRVSPAGLAQINVTPETINSGGVATADGKKKKEVPIVRNQTASKRGSFTCTFQLVFAVTQHFIDTVNAFFKSVNGITEA